MLPAPQSYFFLFQNAVPSMSSAQMQEVNVSYYLIVNDYGGLNTSGVIGNHYWGGNKKQYEYVCCKIIIVLSSLL